MEYEKSYAISYARRGEKCSAGENLLDIRLCGAYNKSMKRANATLNEMMQVVFDRIR